MTDVVVVRPCTDAVEQTLSLWVDLLLPPGTGLPGVNVVQDLYSGVLAAAAQAACSVGDVVLYFGHGTQTTLGDPTLLDTTTIGCAANRTVIAIACLSSDTLGPTAVNQHNVNAYLGFSEPLFVYNARPSVIGTEVVHRLGDFLVGRTALTQARDDLRTDLQQTEALFHNGFNSTHPDAALIWMGARMNWRGLELA